MSDICKETRLESYFEILGKRAKKYRMIIEMMFYENRPISAKELSIQLFASGHIKTTDRNETAPRLNELENLNIVEVVGKQKCKYSGRLVALYKLV